MIIIFLIIAVFCVLLCYASVVEGADASKLEEEYWQRKVREDENDG